MTSCNELDDLCWPIFQRLWPELKDKYHKWLIAIEPETGDYFLGQDDHDILVRARKKYPQGVFFMYCLADSPFMEYLC